VYDACVPPAEVCNGADDNCNMAVDEGFPCAAGSSRACTSLGMGFVSGMAFCRADCSGYDPSTCSRCGDGVRQMPEQCDMGDLGGAMCTTIPGGFNAGTLSCFPSCTYNTSACTRCGDNVRNGPEQCDGVDLAGQSCATQGYTGGGTMACSAMCTFNTGSCIWSPTGTWVVTGPSTTEYCAFGAVDISLGNLTFTDTGSGLSVQGTGGTQRINCTLTGPSARVSRMINVTCMVPGGAGGCTETYTLTGTFTTNNTWTGSFASRFSGGSFACGDCVNNTITNLMGSRM